MEWKAIFMLLNSLFFQFHCQDIQDAKNVLRHLFQQDNYDKKIRPVQDQSKALELDVSLFLVSVNGVDEVQEKLVTTCYLEIVWFDESLVWDTDLFNGIYRIYIPQDDVWKPDLVLKNGFGKFGKLGGDFYYVDVDYIGKVTWLPYEVFESRCYIDITYFPFDKQTCNITFSIWSHSVNEVIIESSSLGFQLYEYEENGAWSITSTDMHIWSNLRESLITFTINMRRKSLYFVMNTIIPIICLGILNTLTFIIPVDSGEKLSFCMTVFLTFAVFLTIVYQGLPANSENIPILGLYLLIQMCYSVFVLLTVSLQLRLHYRSDEKHVGGGCLAIVVLYKKISLNKCRRHSSKRVGNPTEVVACNIDQGDGDIKLTDNCSWRDVSSAIDFFAFWFCLISEAIVTTIILTIMTQA